MPQWCVRVSVRVSVCVSVCVCARACYLTGGKQGKTETASQGEQERRSPTAEIRRLGLLVGQDAIVSAMLHCVGSHQFCYKF